MNNLILPLSSTDKVLSEFFEKDGGFTPNGLIRRSTLLACDKDYRFLRGIKLDQPPYNLDKIQYEAVLNNMPAFACILVYSSMIDLLARVMKRSVATNKSRIFFIWSAHRWFKLSNSQSKALWKLRCAMSHQYRIEKDQRAVPYGFNSSMLFDRKTKRWVFNLNGMYGDIRLAKRIAYEYIKNCKLSTRHKYARFIYEYGFFYTHK